MDNKIQLFNNDNLKIKVRAIQNEDGSISVNAEDVAIGYGWVQTKGDKPYIKWERMNKFIIEVCGENSPQVGKDDYIPESLFYLLGMKAKNDVAKEFQKWLAMEVIPSIRTTGSYVTTKSEEPKLLGTDLVDKLDSKIESLGVYYKPKHKKKLEINKQIKDLLIYSTKENCDKVKEMLLYQLGYEIYDDVPIDILHSTDTANKILEICKIVNGQGGNQQVGMF